MRRMIQRARRGLTLIEVLVMIAIVGLLMTVLVFYLLGDDDRRCRLEAERLAVFLTAASAESVMSDGPTRVAFDLEPQTCIREMAHLRAGVSGGSWEPDKAADPLTIRKPVRMTELANAHGVLTSGTGWFVFNARRVQGGVVLLTLNEAMWSVVVPNDKSEILVKRGRVKLPEPAPLIAGMPKAPLPAFPEMPSGDNTPSFPSSPPATASKGPSAKKEATPKAATEPTPEPTPEPTLEPEITPEPEVTPEVTPEPPFEPEPELDMGVDEPDAGPECVNNTDCPGRFNVCHEGKCKLDLNGESFRMNRVTVGDPAALATFIQEAFNQQIGSFRYNLVVKLAPNHSGAPGVEEERFAWISQAEASGSNGEISLFTPDPSLPSFLGLAEPMSCGDGFVACYNIKPQNELIDLYLPLPAGDRANAIRRGNCPYQTLSIIASMQLYIKSEGDDFGANMSLTGMITKIMAESLQITHDGRVIGLDQLFSMYSVTKDADSNDDDQPDAWQINFTGTSYRVGLLGNLEDARGRVPDNCGE